MKSEKLIDLTNQNLKNPSRGHKFLSTLGFSCEGHHCEQALMSPSPLSPRFALVPTPKKNQKKFN